MVSTKIIIKKDLKKKRDLSQPDQNLQTCDPKLNKNPINKILRDKITKESSNKKELKTRQIVIKRISTILT